MFEALFKKTGARSIQSYRVRLTACPEAISFSRPFTIQVRRLLDSYSEENDWPIRNQFDPQQLEYHVAIQGIRRDRTVTFESLVFHEYLHNYIEEKMGPSLATYTQKNMDLPIVRKSIELDGHVHSNTCSHVHLIALVQALWMDSDSTFPRKADFKAAEEDYYAFIKTVRSPSYLFLWKEMLKWREENPEKRNIFMQQLLEMTGD